jgi:voltage-gated potassium channel
MLKPEARRWQRLRRRTYALLEGDASDDHLAHFVHAAIVGLILVSVVTVVLESVPSLDGPYGDLFRAVEIVAGVVFTVEYLLRLWSAVEHAPLRREPHWRARWLFASQPSMLVDLVAVLPFFLSVFAPEELKVLLIFRLIRFFKLARYSPGMRSLIEAIAEEKRALLACLVILCGLMIVAAAVMHMVEGKAQPEKFGSIPESMWWAIITLTTVGYGDAYPITPLGKVVAGVTALFGLVMLALPVGIIATSFSDVIRRREFNVTWAMVAKLPLFQGLDAASIAELLPVMRSRMAEPGETICRRGVHEDCMYVVVSGRVEEFMPRTRLTLSEGQAFAEESVLEDCPCACTVRALERTRLLALDRHDFQALMEREPHLRAEIEAGLAARQAKRAS